MNNFSNETSQENYDPTPYIQLWVYGLFLPLISISGIMVNLISIVIFSQRSMRSLITTYLTGLSCFDLAVLLGATFVYPSMAYCVSFNCGCTVFYLSAMVSYPFSLMARFGSVWSCVFITVDRFIAVMFPLQQRYWCTMRNARKIHYTVSVCAIGFCFPTMFELRLDEYGRLTQTEFRLSWVYSFWYKANLNLIVLLIIPWTIMITLNFVIIKSIRRAVQLRHAMSASRRFNEDRRFAIIAVLVCTTLLVSNLLSLINNYIQETESSRDFYVLKRIFVFLGNILVCINSATNFLIYCTFGPKYRQKFFAILCGCCRNLCFASGSSSRQTSNTVSAERAPLLNRMRRRSNQSLHLPPAQRFSVEANVANGHRLVPMSMPASRRKNATTICRTTRI